MTETILHRCGCVTGPDAKSGATRSFQKCHGHVAERAAQPQGEAYYRSIGVLDAAGRVRTDHYAAELLEAVGPLPDPPERSTLAVEVGCGLSPYVPLVRSAGYGYVGVEPDRWAADEMAKRFGAAVIGSTFEAFVYSAVPMVGLVLCCHTLEHMADAPAALSLMSRMLAPGGHLVLIVPDDTDLLNPDHLWFFSPESLYSCLTAAGFEVPTVAVRRHVERENFIYCVARKRDTTRG